MEVASLLLVLTLGTVETQSPVDEELAGNGVGTHYHQVR
jgi:hypothetical protein